MCVKMTFLRIFEVSNSREKFEGRLQSGDVIFKNKLKAENQWQMIKETGSWGTLAREREGVECGLRLTALEGRDTPPSSEGRKAGKGRFKLR